MKSAWAICGDILTNLGACAEGAEICWKSLQGWTQAAATFSLFALFYSPSTQLACWGCQVCTPYYLLTVCPTQNSPEDLPSPISHPGQQAPSKVTAHPRVLSWFFFFLWWASETSKARSRSQTTPAHKCTLNSRSQALQPPTLDIYPPYQCTSNSEAECHRQLGQGSALYTSMPIAVVARCHI